MRERTDIPSPRKEDIRSSGDPVSRAHRSIVSQTRQWLPCSHAGLCQNPGWWHRNDSQGVLVWQTEMPRHADIDMTASVPLSSLDHELEHALRVQATPLAK